MFFSNLDLRYFSFRHSINDQFSRAYRPITRLLNSLVDLTKETLPLRTLPCGLNFINLHFNMQDKLLLQTNKNNVRQYSYPVIIIIS